MTVCSIACSSPRPDGSLHHYDKRHLFRYAKEHERYAAGRDRLTVEWKGWRICPLVCYDLRFPVYSRNRFDVERPGGLDYDLLLYVANWPAARAQAWKALLPARAIENLSYVAGLNRVGIDGNGLHYSGDSAVFDFLGSTLRGTWRRGNRGDNGAKWRSIDRPPRAIPGDARCGSLFVCELIRLRTEPMTPAGAIA